MSGALIARIAAFVLYLTFMVYIGLRYMKHNKSSEDFFLGGRKIGPWMTALSAEASDMSGWLLMGLPGVAYLSGLKEAFWTAAGLEIGTYLNWFFVAKRLRRYTEACGNAITIPEFLTNRFKDTTHTISFISVIFILIFFTVYTASGFVACGQLINTVFNIPYIPAVFIGMIVILAYTMAGGYMAVCATDFAQGSLMFFALIITAGIMMVSLGGPAEASMKVSAFGAQFLNPFVDTGTKFGPMEIISALGWGLGYFGMPHILVRFMGINDDKDIPLSRRIAMVWVTLAFISTLMIGAYAKVYLTTPLAHGAQETVFIETLKQMYPAFIGGIFLCAILAAAMSTASSQLLVSASAFCEDFVANILKRQLPQKQMVIISRLTVVVIALVAFIMSLNQHSTIFKLVSYAWAGFGATFGPLILLALFWRGTTSRGAIAGIIAGGVTVIVWHNLHGGIFNLYEIIPGFLMCLLFAIIFSVTDNHINYEMLQEFDTYKAGLKKPVQD